MTSGDIGALTGIFSLIVTGILTWYATHSGNKSTNEATAVAWSRELRGELDQLRTRIEKLEHTKRHMAGFIDDFGYWVSTGAAPPPPFPPTAIHEQIEMGHWERITKSMGSE